mgnify:CR=1 FL=1
MTNICTKVTVRKRPIKNGQLSLYLDFYPPVRHPKTGKPTRREYLGIYIYATRQRSLKRSSTRPCSAMRNSSSAGEPKPSSTRSSAFLTGTGVRRASWNTSNPKWRTMTISEIGIPPTSILKSTVVEAALLMI